MAYTQTISLTFGDQAENHTGMQKFGNPLATGLTCEEIALIHAKYGGNLIPLHMTLPGADRPGNEACVLLIPNGIRALGIDPDALFQEQLALDHDRKALMRGRVVNKHARYNLCYADFAQEPNYKDGKGRVINFNTVPEMQRLRQALPLAFTEKANNLVAELNLYYDPEKCGIGFHSDLERKIVICARLGADMPLHFQWYKNSKAQFEKTIIIPKHGDIYIMSEKAVAPDGRKKKIYTLRHAAGSKKYTG